ncbi:MAG TPA: M48 family metalloprotease [Stellaceae bacterium]|nr:M48 family metalloprotease [Stellaceae bacterium]
MKDWGRRWLLAAVAALAALMAAPQTRASDELTNDDFKAIAAKFGGVYADPAIAKYVTELGNKLVATTPMAGQKFTFTVLNSPIVNAFALPGGYVFVTRGVLALANNEAELAGVMGHEIGHVTARHVEARVARDEITSLGARLAQVFGAQLGNAKIGAYTGELAGVSQLFYIRRYSREQEFQADQLGTETLARAGYDPHAMASFLASLGAWTRLGNRMAGRPEDYNDFSMFADHPRTPDRVDRAVAEAAGLNGRTLDRDGYLARIEGLMFDDDPALGVLRGTTFAHPALRLAFDLPEGFEVENGEDAVLAENDDHAGMIFDRSTETFDGSPEDYVSKVWAPKITARPQHLDINGMPAAAVSGQLTKRDGTVQKVRLVAIRYDASTIYRFLFLIPDAGVEKYEQAFDRVARSFRRLTPEQAAVFKPYRVRVVTVAPGDTVASLAARYPYRSFQRDRFLVLNALGPDAQLTPGQKVKLIVE